MIADIEIENRSRDPDNAFLEVMYAGRVARCAAVIHAVYASRALLRLQKTGRTDGRTPDRCITLTVRRC